MLTKLERDTYVIVGQASGRTYRVRRINRAFYRGVWDVCTTGGGRYATFATLPGARRWALEH